MTNTNTNTNRIKVGVNDNSTDWGIIGISNTLRGAKIIGRRWARQHSTQTGYMGYGPTITLHYATGENQKIKAW